MGREGEIQLRANDSSKGNLLAAPYSQVSLVKLEDGEDPSLEMTQKADNSIILRESVKNAEFVVSDIKRKVTMIENRLSRGDSLIEEIRLEKEIAKEALASSFRASQRNLEGNSTAIGSVGDVHQTQNILLPHMNFTSANFFALKSNTQMEDWRTRSMSSGGQPGMHSARATNRIVNPLNHITDGVVRKIHLTSGQIVKRLMNADKPRKQMSEGRVPKDTSSSNPF